MQGDEKMNKKQLTYFLTAYEAKSLQKAADLLYVSRQGLSKMIRSLEDELGEPLFRRTPKGLVATDFAIATGPVDNIRFNSMPLFFSRYCLQLAKKHPLAAKSAISYTDLQGQKLITKGKAGRCFQQFLAAWLPAHHKDKICWPETV